MARRDEWLERAARRDRSSTGPTSGWRRRGLAVLVGWLVLMTVWGVGRSGFPDRVGWFLAVGLVGGAIATTVLWRR